MTRLGDWIAWAVSRVVLGFLVAFVFATILAPVAAILWPGLFR